MQGYHISAQSALDWPQMGQIKEFFKSDFSTFWLAEQKITEIEKVPDLTHLGQSDSLLA